MSSATLLALASLAAAILMIAGGAGALRDLYRVAGGRVLAVALRILRDRAEAEDVVQDTFLELWRRADRYDPRRASPETWAVVIARSRAIDRLRARGTAARAAEAQAREPEPEAPTLEPAEARQERESVRQALAELPAEQREALELACWEGLTHREISARTGQPLGTVKTRVRRAMARLQDRLGPERGTP
jgi:RNA polymerase sigma-70 factor (ECF subfamily)